MAFPHLSQPVAQGVRVLDADPDLGANLQGERFEQARQALVARTEGVGRGAARWRELRGWGRPRRRSQDGFTELLAPFAVSWRVIEPLMLAHLDVRFVARAARFPEMTGELVSRALDRSRLLARMLAVAQLPRVDTRLLIAMWHLSERWGTVRPEGRVLPGFLSHELLGWIVGARRPSVTTALGQLSQRGLVRRQSDGTWLLGEEPPVFEGLAVA